MALLLGELTTQVPPPQWMVCSAAPVTPVGIATTIVRRWCATVLVGPESGIWEQ